jgi:uncharacterized membrane protein
MVESKTKMEIILFFLTLVVLVFLVVFLTNCFEGDCNQVYCDVHKTDWLLCGVR